MTLINGFEKCGTFGKGGKKPIVVNDTRLNFPFRKIK
jgi:hypothetical protein